MHAKQALLKRRLCCAGYGRVQANSRVLIYYVKHELAWRWDREKERRRRKKRKNSDLCDPMAMGLIERALLPLQWNNYFILKMKELDEWLVIVVCMRMARLLNSRAIWELKR
jgi:hypothetical protein